MFDCLQLCFTMILYYPANTNTSPSTGQRAVSVDGLKPMSCNALRFGLSTILLIIFRPFINTESSLEAPDHDDDHLTVTSESISVNKSMKTDTQYVVNQMCGASAAMYFTEAKKTVLFWGIFLGVVNFAGSGFQQWGIAYTSASKVAFIAGFDLFLIPIFTLLLPTMKPNGRISINTWVAVMISLCGLYLLSGASISDLNLGRGETITLISTLFWTVHVVFTDIATNHIDSLQMMVVQLAVVTLLSTVFALILEPQGWFLHHILLVTPWLIFLAMTEGLAFALMAMGQTFSPPTHAAIILSLEGVFASIADYFCLGETLSYSECAGCLLMLIATLVAKVGFCGLADSKVLQSKEGTDIEVGSPCKSKTSVVLSSLIYPFNVLSKTVHRMVEYCKRNE